MDANGFRRKHKRAVDLLMRIRHGWEMPEQELAEAKRKFSRDVNAMERYLEEMRQGEPALPGQQCRLCERPIWTQYEADGIDGICLHCKDQLMRYPDDCLR
jgi:hypothetical protein